MATDAQRIFRFTSESKARKSIGAALDRLPRRVLGGKDVLRLINEQRAEWGVLATASSADVLEYVEHAMGLQRVLLKAEAHDKEFTRYLWRKPSSFEVAASLRSSAYLCHSSAMYIHGLTNEGPRVLYVNSEQSEKPRPEGGLTQEGIDRAFKGKQRASKFVFNFGDTKIVLLNGKNTNGFGTANISIADGYSVRATNLERTLIDIVVRPAYAGGVNDVLDAYRHARERLSVTKLVKTLLTLDYVYPYHQAVGFYLARAGCGLSALKQLKDLGLDFDFYLAHNIDECRYDPEWRVYLPKSL